MTTFPEGLNGRRARVLLYGHINLNVIDGSAFFLSALADVLSIDPLIEVDVALAVPLTRTLVIEDFLNRDNVSLLDPFTEAGQDGGPVRGRLSHSEAAAYLAEQMEVREHDIAFIRSTEVVAHLAILAAHLMPRVVLYVTNIVSPDQPVPAETVHDLHRIVAAGARIACQTPEMAEHVGTTVLGGRTGAHDVVVMSPVVRASSDDFAAVFQPREHYTRFVYTGKFFRDWIPQKIVSGFKRAHLGRPALTLDVAGDQFREDPEDPEFVAVTRYLLEHTKALTWHGGITREASRALIARCDVGVSWRSGRLDDSLELSTKLLEFGALGKPCIMNRTPMHERIFGADYPLFADTPEEFVAALRLCADDPFVVERAAKRAFTVSTEYTMQTALRRLLSVFPQPTLRLGDVPNSDIVTMQLTERDGGFSQVRAALVDRRLLSHRFTGPTLELQLADAADPRKDQSLELIRTLFERQCRMTVLRQPPVEEQGIQLDLPRGLTPGSASIAGPLGVTAVQSREIHSLHTQLRKAEHAAAELTATNQALRADLAARGRSLQALSVSKLGRLQLGYWKLRKRRRR